RAPAEQIALRRLVRAIRRAQHHLAPEEALQVVAPLAADEAVRREEVEPAVVVEVEEDRAPAPAAVSGPARLGDVAQACAFAIEEQRVARRVVAEVLLAPARTEARS